MVSAVVTAQLLAFLMMYSHTEIQDLTCTFTIWRKQLLTIWAPMKALLREGKRSEGSLGMWEKKKLREHLIISSLAYPSQRECSAFASFSRALNLLHFMIMTFLSGTLNVPIKVRGLWPQFKK